MRTVFQLMRVLILIAILSFHSFSRADNCAPYSPADNPVKRAPRITENKVELDADHDATYFATERLGGRAFRAPEGGLVIPYSGKMAAVPARFSEGVATHLHAALSEGIADAVVYADMGHLHLLLPDSRWQAMRDAGGVDMAALLNSPDLKALYHTAEMVHLKDGDFAKGKLSRDVWKQWRYFTRNLLGTFGDDAGVSILFEALEAMYNTVRELPGLAQVSTLYISANHAGCFPFQNAAGEENYFDMTFEDIPYAP